MPMLLTGGGGVEEEEGSVLNVTSLEVSVIFL